MAAGGNGWKAGAVLRAVSAGLAVCLALSAAAPQARVERLRRLFEQTRYFELRKALESEPDKSGPDILFFRGMTANAFFRPRESAGDLEAYLERAGPAAPTTTRREALEALADDYVKMFRFGKAAETKQRILDMIRNELQPKDLAAFEETVAFWRRLAALPRQTITISGDTEVPLAGRTDVPAVFGEREVPLIPDTGSSLCLIIRRDAERLGFPVLETPLQIGTATGEAVAAYPCLVPEMTIGRVTVQNAIFLVVPERMLYDPQNRRQRSGTIGFPVLAALRELTLTRKGTLIIPARPALSGPPDFFLYRTNPVVKVEFEGTELHLILDTGANRTQLYPRFFRAFRTDVLKSGIPAASEISGVGSEITVPTYLMPRLSFQVAGRKVTFAGRVAVLTEPTDAASDIFDGVFGIDLLDQVDRVTINYAALRFELR